MADACLNTIKPLIQYDTELKKADLDKIVEKIDTKDQEAFRQKIMGLLTPERRQAFEQDTQSAAQQSQTASPRHGKIDLAATPQAESPNEPQANHDLK